MTINIKRSCFLIEYNFFFSILVTSGSIATFRKAVNIPFIYIVDNYRYDEIYDRVKPDNVDAFIAELTKTIKDTNAHGLAFDYMNSVQTEYIIIVEKHVS